MKYSNNKIPSNRKFGYTFTIIFFLSSVFVYKNLIIFYTFLVLSLVLLLVTTFLSRYLRLLNILWFKFGELLNKIISPIILTFVYYLLFVPFSFAVKLFIKNLLEVKFDKNQKTYWINRTTKLNDMKDQY